MKFNSYTGKEMSPWLDQVAAMRIKYFRQFPYLYAGDLQYEKLYLQAYATDPKAMLVTVSDGEHVLAISTAIPLVSSSEIVSTGPELFSKAGWNPEEFYYFGEVIVVPSHRKMGLARLIYAIHERQAKDWGFKKLCLAVVVRPDDHALAPAQYNKEQADRVWTSLGFAKTHMILNFHWPVIQSSGEAVELNNELVFWTKDIS